MDHCLKRIRKKSNQTSWDYWKYSGNMEKLHQEIVRNCIDSVTGRIMKWIKL